MVRTIGRDIKAVAALAVATLATCLLLLGSPTDARAGVSNYCNNYTLGGWAACSGAARTLYAVYGWGDQRSVCVWAAVPPGGAGPNSACSGGAGQGAYAPQPQAWLIPYISNNSGVANTVHGVAYQP